MNPQQLAPRYRTFGGFFRLSTRLEAIGNRFLEGLTVKQWYCLAVLTTFFDQPPTLGALALAMGTSHQNAKQVALRLEAKGYVALRQDAADRRACRVGATERAMAYGKTQQARNEAFLQEAFAGLSPADLESLAAGMERIDGNLARIQAALEEDRHA